MTNYLVDDYFRKDGWRPNASGKQDNHLYIVFHKENKVAVVKAKIIKGLGSDLCSIDIINTTISERKFAKPEKIICKIISSKNASMGFLMESINNVLNRYNENTL